MFLGKIPQLFLHQEKRHLLFSLISFLPTILPFFLPSFPPSFSEFDYRNKQKKKMGEIGCFMKWWKSWSF